MMLKHATTIFITKELCLVTHVIGANVCSAYAVLAYPD